MTTIINVTAGQAQEVQAKTGEFFSPTGDVLIHKLGHVVVRLDNASVMRVLGDRELFESASDSLCRCAVSELFAKECPDLVISDSQYQKMGKLWKD